MAGDARQGTKVKSGLREPFRVFFDSVRHPMTVTADLVELDTRHVKEFSRPVRVMAIDALGIFSVQALAILAGNGTMTLIAGNPGRLIAIRRM